MGCKEFPTYDKEDKIECPCERTSTSELSPGLVINHELLARLIFSPIHINENTGRLDPSAFSDVKTIGLSVNRKSYSTNLKIVDTGNKKVIKDRALGRTDREFVGIVEANCGDIRDLLADDSTRGFCVYDTSLPDNTSHADVCQSDSLSRGAGKKLRKRLKDVFGDEFISPEDYAV